MWDLMKQVCGAMGVRTNVPFNQLTEQERDIVFAGPAIKKHILYKPKKATIRRTRLHVLQRRIHRGERPHQSQGRKRA